MSKPFRKVKYTGVLGLDSQLDFGMYQGYTVQEILKDRPDYIRWLMANTALKFTEDVIVPRSYKFKIPKDVSQWQNSRHWKDHDDVYSDMDQYWDDIPF